MSNSSCPLCYSNRHKEYLNREDVNYVKCAKCGIVYLREIPHETALTKFYANDFFNESTNALIENMIERRKEQLNIIESLHPEKGRLLDIGCGHGHFLKEAQDRSWKVQGLDISPFAANHVKKTLGIDIFLGNIEEAHYDDSYFDVVTLWDILEHIKDPSGMLKEIWRIVKGDGIVAVSTPNVKGVNAIFYKERWPYYDFKSYGHLLQFSPSNLKRLLEECGFRVIQITTSGSLDIRYIPSLWRLKLSNSFLLCTLDKLSGLAAKFIIPLKLGNTVFLCAAKH